MVQYTFGIKTILLASLVMLSTPAYAYLDPGTGSIIFQAIIASVVMGLTTIKLWWAKFKDLFSARKKTEPEQAQKQSQSQSIKKIHK
ncbi:hypothetical protein [Shewanella sp. 4_MG-2023]|uniref:hypothetical protein n=1 Tax=Shewanella sp. 4_MG-2023 TaxID=3062652 RepID=UPI0026E47A4D|nr:hypothetical protein [Shewanella sp. 4_MG-2023]MDO6677543.1 hypothetical protein [Shewanella sp. 4_MG-2023]